MITEIVKLEPADFEKCGSIWDMQKQIALAEKFYREMQEGISTTYIYKIDGAFIGEISVVTDAGDPDYTIPGQRLYVSRLIVKRDHRRQGIGKRLVEFVSDKAKEAGYTELSIGVDLNNFPALKLYHAAGFDTILFIGEDQWGKYAKLIKQIC